MTRIIEKVIVDALALALFPAQLAHVQVGAPQRFAQSFKLMLNRRIACRVRIEGNHDLSQLRHQLSQPPAEIFPKAPDFRERDHAMTVAQQVRGGVCFERAFRDDHLTGLPYSVRIAEMRRRAARRAVVFAA